MAVIMLYSAMARLTLLSSIRTLGVKAGGLNKVLLADPASVAGAGGLRAEGAQVYKYNGYYYIFNICWPNGGMRYPDLFQKLLRADLISKW